MSTPSAQPGEDRQPAVGWRRAARTGGSWLFVAVVVGMVAFLWPAAWGGSTSLTVVAGHSMEPTYVTGDLVIGRAGPAHVGDVIVYEPEGHPGSQIVHRIVGGNGVDGWVMQGDGNDWQDPFHPTAEQVVGVVQVHVPHVAAVTNLLTAPFAWAAYLLIVLGVLLWPTRDSEDDPTDDENPDEADLDPDQAPADGAGSEDRATMMDESVLAPTS